MILEIDIDYEAEKITVRGKHDHSYHANGNTPLQWQAKPGKQHKKWTVTFPEEKCPFKHGECKFGKEGEGPDGGQLVSNNGDAKLHFPYDVTCTDKNDKTFNSDPEVVVWPD